MARKGLVLICLDLASGNPGPGRASGRQGQVKFRVYALRRMFQRQISSAAVLHVLDNGTTVEQYPDDFPYPSRLVFGWWESRPLHVVVADNIDEGIRIVVTAYEPDLEEWEPGFRRRRKP